MAFERREGVQTDKAVDEQGEGIITTFPDELLLYIFQYLEGPHLVTSIAHVSKRWKRLSCDPKLWKKSFIFYNSRKPCLFVEMIHNVNNQNVEYLHLGGHEPIDEIAMQALFSSNIVLVKKLSLLGSCRTNPSKVIKLLSQFRSSIESLTLCVNDELVSYGEDGETCYSLKDSRTRPGLLFKVISCMENLKHLRLCGGFSPRWYFAELRYEQGCSKIEALDLKDFEEVFDSSFSSCQTTCLIGDLIFKNKGHLKSIKLSEKYISNDYVRHWVLRCGGNVKEFLINIAYLDNIIDALPGITSLHLGGRYSDDWGQDTFELANFNPLPHEVEELTLFQFTSIPNHDFLKVIRPFHKLRVLRIEGSLLSTENLMTVSTQCKFIDRLCIRNTNLVARRHLISMRISFSVLEDFDFEQVQDLDCSKSILYHQNTPFLKLNVIQTGCFCKKELHVAVGLEKKHMTNLSLRLHNTFNETQKKTQHVDITLSNDLQEEFLHNCKDFKQSDIIFHFNQ